ncbi:ABC transporter permease [Chitinophaga japonensis]|nr:ABC transporter permease [Chitinophaga japonensis]
MLYYYLKNAWRNLWKDRFYALLNITGLALAMAAFLLINNYVRFERSYENFYTKSDHIYRVTLDRYRGGEFVVTDCETHPPLGPALKKEMPEVKEFVRIQDMGRAEVTNPQHQAFLVEKVYAADPSVFTVFNHDFIQGDPQAALNNPFTAVLTASTAQRLFGSRNPIGQPLQFKGSTLTVTGVIKDLPANTHLKMDLLLSFSSLQQFGIDLDSWNGNNNYTYLEMTPHTDLAAFNAKLKTFSQKQLKNALFTAEPVRDIHLYSHKTFEPEVNGDARTVQFLQIIAFLVLLIGTVNYVNLTTARSSEQLKEAGIKKVLGASRATLVKQFFAASMLINLAAFLSALLLVKLALPFYANIAGKPAAAGIFYTPYFWSTGLLLLLANCLLSGLYPAFALSAIKPVSALTRSFTNGLKGGALRRTLVVGQFTIAAVVLVASIVIYRQLRFMQDQDLGLDTEQVLVLRGPDANQDSSGLRAFKQELLQVPGVEKTAMAGSMPGLALNYLSTTTSVKAHGADQQAGGYNYYLYGIDADLVPTLNMQLAAGRNFIDGSPNKNAVLVNEEACRLLGLGAAEKAVGKQIDYWGNTFTVVGVLKNYHQQSLKDALLPMIHWYADNYASYFTLKVRTRNMRQTIAGVEKKWQEHFRGHPFEYFFLDDLYNQQYKTDTHFGQIVGIFSLFTLFITCLGLLGLASYSVARRTREIGIRKVLGASAAGILHLLTKDFIRLVLIAIVLATPLAWWAMDAWLQGFAYRISIPWWAFVSTGLLMMLIAALTVGGQSLKTALTNPVKSLRSE